MIQVKRVYDPYSPNDGARYLVERLWPRGIKKESLHVDQWLKDVAPSPELRRWFNHDPGKWAEFKRKYRAELDAHPDVWRPLLAAARCDNVTLFYSAHDTEHNNAVALKDYLDSKLRRH